MDLDALDVSAGAEKGFELELLHPSSGKPLGIHITVKGADSETYREKKRELQTRRMELVARGRKDAGAMMDTVEQDAHELLAAVTTGWRNVTRSGVPLSFSQPEAQKLYQRYGWIAEQVDAAIRDRANFLPGCATT